MMVFSAQLAEGGGGLLAHTDFHSILPLYSNYVALSPATLARYCYLFSNQSPLCPSLWVKIFAKGVVSELLSSFQAV